MEIELTHIGLIIMQHPKHRIVKVFKDLSGNKISTHNLSKAEIVGLLQEYDEKLLVKAFKDMLFASNQSLTFVRYSRRETDSGKVVQKEIQNGLSAIKKNIEVYETLAANGYSPLRLGKEPTLLKIFSLDKNKTAFLFGSTGKTLFIRKNLKLVRTSDPDFDLCVWDNTKNVLQIRSAQNVEFYKDYFSKMLKNSPDAIYENLTVDPDSFDEFVARIGGIVRSVKGKDPTKLKSYLEKDLKSQSDVDVRTVESYDEDIDGYDIISHGVDFIYGGMPYTVHVGMKTGSVWLRFGDPTEDLLNFLQEVVLELN